MGDDYEERIAALEEKVNEISEKKLEVEKNDMD
jgi:hypothetical protein